MKTKVGDKMISGNGKTPGLGNCGGFGQKNCKSSAASQSKIPKLSVEEHFQMFQTSDPYYYGSAAEESYSDYSFGGESHVAIDSIGLVNDVLVGIRPFILNRTVPYSQTVTIGYQIEYTNIPRIISTNEATMIDMQISNKSKTINSIINYTVSVQGGNMNVVSKSSAAPGGVANISIPTMLVPANGIEIRIAAFTGCTGPCISSNMGLNFVGSTSFVFSP